MKRRNAHVLRHLSELFFTHAGKTAAVRVPSTAHWGQHFVVYLLASPQLP